MKYLTVIKCHHCRDGHFQDVDGEWKICGTCSGTGCLYVLNSGQLKTPDGKFDGSLTAAEMKAIKDAKNTDSNGALDRPEDGGQAGCHHRH